MYSNLEILNGVALSLKEKMKIGWVEKGRARGTT